MKRYSLITCTCLVTFFLVFLPNKTFAVGPQTLLQESEYYQTLHELFSQAENSIDIVVDSIVITPLKPGNPINKLMETLIKAKKRGLRIRVILEDARSPKNFIAYRSLLENGIDVYFDVSKLLIDSKAIVIDSHICVVGGLNWSPHAWRENYTLSVILDSEDMAQAVQGSISKFLSTEEFTFFIEERPKGISVPDDFLLLENFGKGFIIERANRPFDLYLLLIKEAQERSSNEFSFDYERWGRLLCLEERFFREFKNKEEQEEYYYRRLKKILKILDGRYQLIEYNDDTEKIVLLKKFDIDLSNPAEKNPCFVLPDKFWDAKLPYRMSLNAKYVYLVSLLEAKKSAKAPYWFSNEHILSTLYDLHVDTITVGLDRLEEMNLIEIAYAPTVQKESKKEDRNVYRINRIITEQEFDRKIQYFSQEYGQEITNKARKEANQLNEPNDLFVIKTFINLIRKYDYPAVRRANVNTLHYRRGSSLRHISTTIKLLEKE